MDGATPRQRAREQNLRRIKELALRQMASTGAEALSLRAIARELNLVSSAIYRYYASRDELLTALIVDAYRDLAEAMGTAAGSSRRTPRRRWLLTCFALRDWAVEHPHRFWLVYATVVPGYTAPPETLEPAGRVAVAFCRPLVDMTPAEAAPRRRRLGGQLDAMATSLDLGLSRTQTLAAMAAFARVVGLVTLELNGQLVGTFEPADELYATLLEREADALGL